MRIALLTDTFIQNNGLAEHVRMLAKQLSKKAQVTVYTGRGSPLGDYDVVNLLHFPFPFDSNYDIIFPMGKVEADVIHAHSPLCTSRLAFKTRKKQGTPVVTTTHTLPQHFFNCVHMNFLEPLGWKVIINFHNKSDHVICQTKATEKIFREHGLKKPASVISVGMDFEKFKKAKASRFRKKYGVKDGFVLSASRLSPEKRVDWVLKACEELSIPVIVLSDGPLRKKLEQEYKHALFLGRIPSQDKYDAFAAATILATASMAETEGIIVNEAMASKTLVVASSIPVHVENLKGTGLIFSSYAELKDQLKKAWEDSELRKKKTKQALEVVKDKDIKVVAEKLLNLYASLI